MMITKDQQKYRPKLVSALKKAGDRAVLAQKTGCSEQTICRVINRTNRLGYTFCEKLHRYHPEYTAAEYFNECRKYIKKAKKRAAA